jgi:hypothetical protein
MPQIPLWLYNKDPVHHKFLILIDASQDPSSSISQDDPNNITVGPTIAKTDDKHTHRHNRELWATHHQIRVNSASSM